MLCSPLISAFEETYKELTKRLLIPQNSEISQLIKNTRLETLLDCFKSTYGSEILNYLSVLNSNIWNFNHSAIAILSKNGFIPWCITLNFDLLIEKSFLFHGLSCNTICSLIRKEFKSGNGSTYTNILKPHGSFVPSYVSDNYLAYLSPTLSEVGENPVPENIKAFEKVFTECTTLLVAGYSDNDWDIFPIFFILKNKPQKIIWIFHPTEDPTKTTAVKNLLNKIDSEVLYLHESSVQVLKEVLGSLGISRFKDQRSTSNENDANPINDQLFMPDSEEKLVKNSLALAILIETSTYNRKLLKWLQNNPFIKKDVELGWQVEHIWNYIYHTEHYYRKARGCKRKEIKLLTSCSEETRKKLPHAYVWLGYEHFSSIKPKLPMFLILFGSTFFAILFLILSKPFITIVAILFPVIIFTFYIKRANYYFNLGNDPNATYREGHPISDYIKYYRVDFLHSWASNLLFLGKIGTPLTTYIFKYVTALYDRLNPSFFATAYFYQRRLESWLLSRDKRLFNTDTRYQMQEFERIDNLINLTDPSGNIPTYEALYNYTIGDTKRQEIDDLLNDAEKLWTKHDRIILSGLYRVFLFRWYMGFYRKGIDILIRIVKFRFFKKENY